MTPPGKGWEDSEPPWSKTGDMTVFFHRVKNDPVVVRRKTILCIVKADATAAGIMSHDVK